MGVFQEGGSRNSWAVLQIEVAIAGEVANSGKHSLAIPDLFAKKNAADSTIWKPPFLEPPPFTIPYLGAWVPKQLPN